MGVMRLGTWTLAVLAFTGCTSDPSQEEARPVTAVETAASTPVDLRGDWEVTVPGFAREGVAADASARFGEPRTKSELVFTDGCNSTTGRYALEESGTLRLRPKGTTLVGCPDGTPPVLTLLSDVVAAQAGPNATVLLVNRDGDTLLQLAAKSG